MRQWLYIIIHECVNGSRIPSLSASTAPEFYPYRRQWLQIAVPKYVKALVYYTRICLVQQSGAIDADRDNILEPLTPIGIKFWSH